MWVIKLFTLRVFFNLRLFCFIKQVSMNYIKFLVKSKNNATETSILRHMEKIFHIKSSRNEMAQ